MTRRTLRERPYGLEWNVFEAKLFNLLIQSDHTLGRRLSFHERMRLADAMLFSHDLEIARIQGEAEAQVKLKLIQKRK